MTWPYYFVKVNLNRLKLKYAVDKLDTKNTTFGEKPSFFY
jgi:hypothetical protein